MFHIFHMFYLQRYLFNYADNPFGDLKSLAPSDNRNVNNGSLIAVSYEARGKGVKRTMRGAEARKVVATNILLPRQ